MVTPSLQFGTLIGWNSMPWLNNRFRLTAILLCDPQDEEFCQHVASSEALWDNATGENMLVFPLINPVDESHPNRRYPHRGKAELFPLEFQHSRAQLNSGAARSMLYNFLTHIEFENAKLPGIVLTTGDFASNEYIYIPSSTSQIDYQLSALGQYCKISTESDLIQSPQLQTLVKEISDGKSVCVTTEGTIAEHLKLVFAVKEIFRGPSSFAWLALRLLMTEVSSDELENFRRINSQIQYRQTFRENLNTDFYSTNESCLPDCRCIDVNKFPDLEAETRMAWNTYNYFISDPRISQNTSAIYISDINISLLKGVESELNASIVQLMRMKYKIPMPEYFRIYMADKTAIPKRGDYAINLNRWSNRNQDGNLYAVSIGDVRAAYLAMNLDCFKGESKRFTDLLYEFSALRKTHTGANHTYDLDDVVMCNKLFHEEFISFFPELIKMKELLKTGRYERNELYCSNEEDYGEEVLDLMNNRKEP